MKCLSIALAAALVTYLLGTRAVGAPSSVSGVGAIVVGFVVLAVSLEFVHTWRRRK